VTARLVLPQVPQPAHLLIYLISLVQGYLAFEDGYARLGDGSVHCAVLTPLPNCTGPVSIQTHEMIKIPL
jgi:hypothetical protein